MRIAYFKATAMLLLIAATPAGAQGFAANQDGAAAVVNGERIPMSEVAKLLREKRPPVHPLTKEQQQEIRQMALDMVINDVLLRQFLQANSPPVPQAAVEAKLAELRKALAAKNSTFAKFLKDTHQTEAQLRQDIVTGIQLRSYVERRLPDSLIKPYYDANKVFFDKVEVRASHILMKYPPQATAAQKYSVRVRLLRLRQDILQGKITFAAAARKYSECPSKKKGGDIGKFPYKFVVTEPFARAAFAMKKGEVSEPVETQFGLHLIYVTERTRGEPSTFAAVKDLVRQVYAQEVRLIPNIISEQRKRAKIEVLMK